MTRRFDFQYVPLDVRFFGNEKVLPLLKMAGGKSAVVLYFVSLCYCFDRLTDGKLSPLAVEKCVKDAMVSKGTSELLIRVGLWEQRRGQLQVHHYLEFNRSRTEVLALREERARAGRLGGQASAQARAVASAQAKSKQNQPTNTNTNTNTNDHPPVVPPDRGDWTRTGKPRRHRPMNDPETAERLREIPRMMMEAWPDYEKLCAARASGFNVNQKTQAEYESELAAAQEQKAVTG